MALATAFADELWLTDKQTAKLSSALRFDPGVRSPAVNWVADHFRKSIQMAAQRNEVTISDPIASLSGKRDVQALAIELAQALAILEDWLRRSDPIGECVRWSARNYPRDFLSFPERVC